MAGLFPLVWNAACNWLVTHHIIPDVRLVSLSPMPWSRPTCCTSSKTSHRVRGNRWPTFFPNNKEIVSFIHHRNIIIMTTILEVRKFPISLEDDLWKDRKVNISWEGWEEMDVWIGIIHHSSNIWWRTPSAKWNELAPPYINDSLPSPVRITSQRWTSSPSWWCSLALSSLSSVPNPAAQSRPHGYVQLSLMFVRKDDGKKKRF